MSRRRHHPPAELVRAKQRNAARAERLAVELEVNSENLASVRDERVRESARTAVAHPNAALGLDREQRRYERVRLEIRADIRDVAGVSEADGYRGTESMRGAL